MVVTVGQEHLSIQHPWLHTSQWWSEKIFSLHLTSIKITHKYIPVVKSKPSRQNQILPWPLLHLRVYTPPSVSLLVLMATLWLTDGGAGQPRIKEFPTVLEPGSAQSRYQCFPVRAWAPTWSYVRYRHCAQESPGWQWGQTEKLL
jgi:hypothetical protein